MGREGEGASNRGEMVKGERAGDHKGRKQERRRTLDVGGEHIELWKEHNNDYRSI
jgi:hypothetical protein